MKSTHPVWVVMANHEVVGVFASEELAEDMVRILLDFGDKAQHYEYRAVSYYS